MRVDFKPDGGVESPSLDDNYCNDNDNDDDDDSGSGCVLSDVMMSQMHIPC